MAWFKGKLGWIFVLGFVAGLAAIAYAPYLPRLLQEGYPQLIWPAPGSFSSVLGDMHEEQRGDHFQNGQGGGWTGYPPLGTPDDARIVKHPEASLNSWSQKLFEAKGGKALLVYYKGKLVVEHYAKGVDKNSRFNSYSMVKSLVGALTLKAVAERKIRSLNDPIGSYLPLLTDKSLARTPLKDFLGMRSGIVFEKSWAKSAFGARSKNIDKSKINPFGPMVRLHMNGLEDVMAGLRSDKKLQGRYSYQNINTALLGRVLVKVYGQSLETILQEKIWQPAVSQPVLSQGAGLSQSPAQWRRYAKGKPVTPYCCLYARPFDWVSVGNFLMNNGSEANAPFLPNKLWRLYMGMDIASDSFSGKSKYGAHIYHNILDRAGESLQGKFVYMLGNGGQTVYMMPKKQLVVVRFGEKIQRLHSTLYAAWRMVKAR